MIVAFDTLYENPYAPSGALDFYRLLLAALERVLDPADQLIIIGSRTNADLFEPTRPNVTLRLFSHANERRLRRILTQQLALPLRLREWRVDVYHGGSVCPVVLPCPAVASVLTMHVFTNPESMGAAKRVYRRLLGRLTLRRAAAVIANSESNKRDIVSYGGVTADKVHVIAEALDERVFHPERDARRAADTRSRFGIQGPYVLFLSSLYPYKNVETLIRAFARVRERLTDHRLVIAGAVADVAYEERLRREVTGRGLVNRTVFTGRVSPVEAGDLYRDAEAFVCVSRYETFGKIYLEAMASGCPVIGSNVSSVPEVTGDAALLVAPDDDAAIALHLERLSRDPAARAELVRRGLARARAFSFQQTAARTYDVYRRVHEAAGA